ncbi:hypothetical protein PsalSR1_00785 [Piscirickettsia salmonis]|nr:hypothetical protein [Piscirickettsia salmonis]QGP53375.1 hypothetical protein PsalSR1_00785 [Piscirickettsia salmonis]
MLKLIKVFVLVLLSLILISCTFSNGVIQAKKMGAIDPVNKNIAMVGDSYYNSDLAEALFQYGFHVKTMISQYSVTKKINKNAIIHYNQSTARYAVQLETTPRRGWTCVFSDGYMLYAKVIITDLVNGNMVMVVKQEGAN